MTIKVCLLGSGSSGNCTLVQFGSCALLFDAGLSAKQTAERLKEVGVDITKISAICLSHEHSDHTRGLAVLHKRYGLQLYANSGTVTGIERNAELRALSWNIFTTGQPFEINGVNVDPFSVPHDAYEPVGFVASKGTLKVGVATDLGITTTLVRERLRPCAVLVVEANHDEQLLESASRPWSLKQRIRGRQGHLSNRSAAEMLKEIAGPHLQQIFLAHLSDDCNQPELALKTINDSLTTNGHTHIKIACGFRNRVSDVYEG